VSVENRGGVKNEKFRDNDEKGHKKFRCAVVFLYLVYILFVFVTKTRLGTGERANKFVRNFLDKSSLFYSKFPNSQRTTFSVSDSYISANLDNAFSHSLKDF